MTTADALLADHRYAEAREAYESLLAGGEDADLLTGLAAACRGLDDVPAALRALERAHRLLVDADDDSAAALVACTIADIQLGHLGAEAIAAGWLARARHHLRRLPDDPAHVPVEGQLAYIALAYAKDPTAARHHAERALAHAQRLQDGSAMVLGKAYLGLIDVTLGDVEAGMSLLDEATAAASAGELPTTEELDTYCLLITACARVRDFTRVEQWARHVLSLATDLGGDGFATFARSQWATVLMWRGRWDEADEELQRILAHAEEQPMTAAMALVLRAQLRLRQGRVAEASRTLEVAEREPYRRSVRHLVLSTRAQVRLASGQRQSAADTAARYLRLVDPSDRIERVEALEVLVAANVELGSLEACDEALAELDATARMLATDGIVGAAEVARGRVALAAGRLDDARAALERAADAFDAAQLPLERAQARLLLARALIAAGQLEAAATEATSVHQAAEELGAAQLLEASATVLGGLRPGGAAGGYTDREVEVLQLLADGRSNAEIAEALVLSVRTVERHVSNIYLKAGATGPAARTAAVAHARSLGVV